ncbi:MAG: sugar kinase [Alphaproteobacteria bacterium]
MTVRIACLGECMVELAPAPEGAGLFRLGVGGDSFNTAAYMKRLAETAEARVHYVTALGEDAESARMIAAFRAEGLETDLVFRVEGAGPGLYLIETDAEGERCFHYWRGESAARQLMDEGRAMALAGALAGFDLVYLTGVSLAILETDARARLIALLEGLGPETRLAFDPNHRPALWDGATAAAAGARLAGLGATVLASADDARALYGAADPVQAVKSWLDAGAAEVVLRRGAAPCLIGEAGAEEMIEAPAQVSVRVRDTTAAGDAFNAAYLLARLRGRAIREAAAAGHALAARVIQTPGALLARDRQPNMGPQGA